METRRVCVRGLINKDGKLFAQKLKNKEGTVNEYWCTPGGGVDPLESLHDALVREMIEETGIAPEIGRLVLIQQFSTRNSTTHEVDEQLEFFFEVTNVDDYETVDISSTSHGEIEVDKFDFIDPSSENILPKVLRTPEFAAALSNQQAPVMIYTNFA